MKIAFFKFLWQNPKIQDLSKTKLNRKYQTPLYISLVYTIHIFCQKRKLSYNDEVWNSYFKAKLWHKINYRNMQPHGFLSMWQLFNHYSLKLTKVRNKCRIYLYVVQYTHKFECLVGICWNIVKNCLASPCIAQHLQHARTSKPKNGYIEVSSNGLWVKVSFQKSCL